MAAHSLDYIPTAIAGAIAETELLSVKGRVSHVIGTIIRAVVPATKVGELVRQGVVEWVLVKADWSGAALLLDVPDVATARATVEALPVAAHRLTSFDLTPVVEPPGAPS